MGRVEKQYLDKVLGSVTLVKSSRARRMSIRLKADGTIVVTVPRIMPFSTGVAFLEANRQWVEGALRKVEARREAAKKALSDEIGALEGTMGTITGPAEGAQNNIGSQNEVTAEYIEQLRRRARTELPPRLKELADANGFKFNRVFIKHNKSNWGSCSAKGNINLNLNLVRLPRELQDYVMLHELCHLRYMNHGAEFHALLESVCPGHFALRRQLRSYVLL